MTKLLGGTDTKMSHMTEDVARRLSRRDALLKGVKGIVATAAAVSVGGAVSVRDAFAATTACGCAYPGCGHCSCRGKSCPTSGCPSGCYICTSADCPNSACIYAGGSWVDSNCPCGRCGYGYYRCYDCRCTGCSAKCGCRSACLCSGCCATTEVKEQMARDEELARAG